MEIERNLRGPRAADTMGGTMQDSASVLAVRAAAAGMSVERMRIREKGENVRAMMRIRAIYLFYGYRDADGQTWITEDGLERLRLVNADNLARYRKRHGLDD